MKLSQKLLPLATLTLLCSCAGTTAPMNWSIPLAGPPLTQTQMHTSVTDPLCTVLAIIELSRSDTTGTKLQVEKYNAELTAACRGTE